MAKSSKQLDLEAFLDELAAEHERLTKSFETSQMKMHAAKDEYRGAHDALINFRSQYGGHLKLMEDGQITVED